MKRYLKRTFVIGGIVHAVVFGALWLGWHWLWLDVPVDQFAGRWLILLVASALWIVPLWMTLEKLVFTPVRLLTERCEAVERLGMEDALIHHRHVPRGEFGTLMTTWNRMLESLVSERELGEEYRNDLEQTIGQLEEREEVFRLITTSAQDAIVLTERNGRIRYWNDAASTMFGRTDQDALGYDLHRMVEFAHWSLLDVAESTGIDPVPTPSVETTGFRNDGTGFPVEITVNAIRIDGRAHVAAIIRDISHRQKLLEAARETDRARAATATAAAVAHEVHQPLTILTMLSDLLQEKVSNHTPITDDLDTIRTQCVRIADIVEKMKEMQSYRTKPYSNGVEMVDIEATTASNGLSLDRR